MPAMDSDSAISCDNVYHTHYRICARFVRERKKIMAFLLRLAIALTIFTVALKLTGNITWSWWWTVSPLWIWILYTLDHMVHTFIAVVDGLVELIDQKPAKMMAEARLRRAFGVKD